MRWLIVGAVLAWCSGALSVIAVGLWMGAQSRREDQ